MKQGNKNRGSGQQNKFGKTDGRKRFARDDQRREAPHRDEKRRDDKRRDDKRRDDKPRGKVFDKRRADEQSRPLPATRKEQMRKETPRKDMFRKEQPKTETVRADAVLLWGLHAARAAWLNPARKIHRAWFTEAGRKLFEDTVTEGRDALLKRPDARQCERTELDRLTPPGSVHQGILIEAAPLPEPMLHDILAADPPPDLILVLDQVTDPHNVGAILRSAAAFGAGAIVMTERNAPASTGVLAKTACGALEHVPVTHVVNLSRAMDELRDAGYWCVGLAEEGARTLSELDLSGRTVLVLGNEGDGMRHLTRQKCDELARLPTQGPIGSLNVSNAAAVALYEVRKQKAR